MAASAKGPALVDQQPGGAYAPQYGGCYCYDASVTIAAETVGKYLAVQAGGTIVAGLLSGWTFTAGRVVDADITSEDNIGGGVLGITCSGNHGLTTGDIVSLTKTNNTGHAGCTRITTTGLTTFNCQDIAYVADFGASSAKVHKPAILTAGAAAAGIYAVGFNVDGKASDIGDTIKFELNVGITPKDNVVTSRETTKSLASMIAAGNISIAAGDVVWVSHKNSSSATHSYVITNFNMHLNKIV